MGSAGANTLNGGLNADVMQGLGGNDAYYVDNAGDQVIEASGGGTDWVLTSVSYTLTAGQEIERLETMSSAGTTAINLTGNELANTLVGNAGANTLNGGLGADLLYGRAGNDTFQVDNAADRVFEAAGEGGDRVLASVSYSLTAGQEIERLETTSAAGTTAINLTGNELTNTLVGNAGANTLNGGAGSDALLGGSGADRLLGGTGDDTLEGGLGADRLEGGAGSDTASYGTSTAGVTVNLATGFGSEGHAEGDRLVDIEQLEGSGYGDRLTGSVDANTLEGQGGNDILTGLAGGDTFVFKLGWGQDRIEDFADGEDMLQLQGTGLTFDDLTVTASGDGILIGTGTDMIHLANIEISQVDRADFLFT
nr:calcium-binding protein [Methylobacterium sp. Leaf108]